MASHEISTHWMGKMQFNSLINGHVIVMDAPPRSGGEDNGPIPKPFVLSALSGCTGMDVVALLRKSDLTLGDMEIGVTGELSKQPPYQYVAIHILFTISAEPAMVEKVLEAISDSQEKFCGVSSMLKKIMPVTWEVKFNGITVFNNNPAALISHN